MGRAKVMKKKVPAATSKDAVPSIESNHVPAQRKRGRPRKAVKEELPAEKKTEERKAQLTGSADVEKKVKKPKKLLDVAESGADSKGDHSEEGELKPMVGRREGSRRKSEPRRATSSCIDTF